MLDVGPAANSTVHFKPMTVALVHDRVQRSFYILDCEVLYKKHWLSEEIINSFVIHTPEDIVGSGYNKGELTTVVEDNDYVHIVVFGIYLGPIERVLDGLYSHTTASFPVPYSRLGYHSPLVRKSWMERAALRPAPMAKITVAPPVTMSPPAKTPTLLVRIDSGSATM